MNRELDGCYFRIVRDGVGQSVCFSDLTKEERNALLADKDTQFLKNLCCYLADRIQELGDIIEKQSQQLLLNKYGNRSDIRRRKRLDFFGECEAAFFQLGKRINKDKEVED